MAGNRFGTWKKRTAAVFMAVCLLGAMPGAVWAADTADGLESSISDSETKKQELEQKNAELSQALEEAKQNAEDQEALHQAYQDKIDVLDQQIEEAYAQVSQLDEEINEAEMMESEETDAEEYGAEPAESPQNIKLLDDLEALRAELEGRREEFQEDASDEVNETEAEKEAEMLSVLQNNWAIKQQKRKTAQTSSLHQRSRKKPQKKDGKAGKSGKKKQVRRRR